MEYKNYIIKPALDCPSLYVVATVGQGGKIPNILDSLFTSTGIAKDTIDSYLVMKELKNGKASN